MVANNASRVYGATNPVFSGTITGIQNGDNITATYATTATEMSPVGSYPITPTLVDPNGKLGNYTVASTNGTLSVTAAGLTVVANNASRVYGATNPVFSGTITGLQNGDNITATYATTATEMSPVGSYPITPTLVDPSGKLANYTVASTNGTLNVTAAGLTVVANNASRAYGATNPVFSGTITGLQNGDNITATYATTATVTSPVGSYAITPTLVDPSGKLANYTVASTNGTLSVTAALLTGTADAKSRLYGDANPPFTVTYSGFVNGQDVSVVTGTLDRQHAGHHQQSGGQLSDQCWWPERPQLQYSLCGRDADGAADAVAGERRSYQSGLWPGESAVYRNHQWLGQRGEYRCPGRVRYRWSVRPRPTVRWARIRLFLAG